MAMADLLSCFPAVQVSTPSSPLRSLSKQVGLLDDFAAPCDVLPVSSSIGRVNTAMPVQLSWPRLVALLAVFVVLDTTKGLAVAWATLQSDHFSSPDFLCAKNMLSISLGLLMAWLLEGPTAVQRCLDFRRALKLFPIAAFLGAAQFCMLQALRAFNPGSLKIMAQLNIPTTAVLSWLILGRRYTAQQWTGIALLFSATIAFLHVRMLFFVRPYWGHVELLTVHRTIGLCYFLASILISCTGSIFAERFLKKTCKVPFYIQKTNLMLGELALSSFLVHASRMRTQTEWEEDLEVAHMDLGYVAALIIWTLHGWMAGLLVKHCSGLVKNISHVLAALVTYAVPLMTISGNPHCWPVSICAVLVLLAILVFASTPELEQPISLSPVVPHANQAVEASNSQDRGAAGKSAASCKGLIIVFVLLDAAKPLLVNWAHENKAEDEHFCSQTFILVQTSLSLLVGMTLAVEPSVAGRGLLIHREWRKRLLRCVHLPSVIRRLPVCCCLALSKLALILALRRLDAGTVRVFCQSSIPLVAICSALFFSRRYSAQQWLSLAAVSVALVAFYYVKTEVQRKNIHLPEAPSRFDLVGVLLILASMSSNCMGSFLVEKFLKQQPGQLYEQKVQLVLGEAALNILLLLAQPWVLSEERYQQTPWKRGFFAGFDHRVFLCVLIWIPAGWSATMLVKERSSLVKVLSQAGASVLTYVFSILMLPEPILWPVVLLAVTVMLASLTFGMDTVKRRSKGSTGQEISENGSSEWAVDSSYSRLRKKAQGG